MAFLITANNSTCYNDENSQSSGSSKYEVNINKIRIYSLRLKRCYITTDTVYLLQANYTMTRWAGHVIDDPALHTMPGPTLSIVGNGVLLSCLGGHLFTWPAQRYIL